MDRKNQDPHDNAFEDQLTEERNPPIDTTEEVAHTERLDPDGDPEEARRLIKGEKGRSIA